MKLSEMRELLETKEIQLTKSLGQNFLHDGNQLRRIMEAAELKPADKVLEIGPGLGPLTERLLATASEVLAIEKDGRLVEVLHGRFDSTSRNQKSKWELIHDDALEFLKRERRDWSAWKLVSNLPYSVASPILVELAQGGRSPQRMVATLQLEVANRLMAAPGDKDYGVLSLLVQLDFEPRKALGFRIPASCFFPEPDVDSACVVLERRAKPMLPETSRDAFQRIVKHAFSQRRKMMLKLLKQEWPTEKVVDAFDELKIPPQERAENVALEQFVRLADLLEVPAIPEKS